MTDPVDIVAAPERETAATLSAIGSSGTREFIRYFAASLLALAIDTGTLVFLTSVAGIPYLVSGALAFLLGLVLIYFLSIYWVFERRDMHNRSIEFGIFLLIGIVGLGINEGVLWILTGFFGFYYLLSKIASVLLVFTWNFFARKHVLFR